MPLPYRNPALPLEERLSDLLARMTLPEKIGQLSQACKRLFAQEEEFDRLVASGRIGSRILSDGGFAGNEGAGLSISDLNASQRVAVEQSRLGIPLLFGRDVIYGQRTMFPIPLAQAATFDPGLVEEACTCIAREAAAVGVHWTFAPMMDVARDPRWGRIIEGYGEDPWLSARMAEAAVRGFQGSDPSDPERILACAKHFVAYAAAEGGRDYETAEVSENTLQNTYLPPFRAAVRAGVATVMSAFQDIGGIPASAHREALTGILKEAWGFDGFVVSDWGAVEQLRHHGVAADEREAAALAFSAGVDMEMTLWTYDQNLANLVETGVIPESRVDDACRRILRAKFRAGLFERPYVDETLWPKVLLCPEHTRLAARVAVESMVLARNLEGILPLAREGLSLALLGPMAQEKRAHLGSWTLDGKTEDTVSIAEGIQRVAPGVELRLALGESADAQLATILGKAYGAKPVDLAVVCVGESHLRHGEASSIADLSLPAGQEELIESLARAGVPLIVVCCSGRPLPIPAAERHANALIYAWNGGTCVGEAVARVLFGLDEPGGRFPMTVPRHGGQIPIYYNRKVPGKLGGWEDRYHAYLDQEFDPLYRFGFGLGYTSFEMSPATASAERVPVGQWVEVSTEVRNTGSREGATVVQCYLRDLVASTARPRCELKGFQKLRLRPGQSRRVTFRLGPDELEFFTARRTWEVEPGRFRVFLGFHSGGGEAVEFTVDPVG